jgi:hypothetical protein
MVSGYHAFSKRDNAKLTLGMDCGLAFALSVMAIWYVSVPRFWDAATSGKEAADSFWLSWHPFALLAVGSVAAGFCSHYLHKALRSWFSSPARAIFILGLGFIAIVLLCRIQTIQRLNENRESYLNRWVTYREQADKQRQELLSSLGTDERTLSETVEQLESSRTGPVGELRRQLEAELENLNNLRLVGREEAAEIESARAHDLQAQGVSPDAYVERLAKQNPGPEVVGSQNGTDPFGRAQALALAAQAVETAEVISRR